MNIDDIYKGNTQDALDPQTEENPEDTRQTPEEGTPTSEPEEVKEPEGDSDTEEKVEKDQESEEGETKPDENPTEKPKKDSNEVDYKSKFANSSRRNQIVTSQFEELQKTLGDITRDEVPTDEEMIRQVPDWEYLSDREKNNERKMVVLEKRQNKIMHTMSNITSDITRSGKIEEYINKEPKLAGKEDEFYKFATDKRNEGASMDVLLSAFLYEDIPEIPEEEPKKPAPQSLERGNPSGGEERNTSPKGLSDEDLAQLRKTNPQKYFQLIRKGAI